MPRSTDSKAATGEAVEEASAVNPGGGEKTVSRWDIQHVCSGGVCASSRPGAETVSEERELESYLDLAGCEGEARERARGLTPPGYRAEIGWYLLRRPGL